MLLVEGVLEALFFQPDNIPVAHLKVPLEVGEPRMVKVEIPWEQWEPMRELHARIRSGRYPALLRFTWVDSMLEVLHTPSQGYILKVDPNGWTWGS